MRRAKQLVYVPIEVEVDLDTERTTSYRSPTMGEIDAARQNAIISKAVGAKEEHKKIVTALYKLWKDWNEGPPGRIMPITPQTLFHIENREYDRD